MGTIATGLELVLAAALFVAALSKLTAWPRWRRTRADLRVAVPGVLWDGLPLLELGIGAGLALGVRPVSGLAAIVLFLAFAAALAIGIARGAVGACNCFGDLMPMAIGPVAIVRAVALAGAAGVALLLGGTSGAFHPLGLAAAAAAAAAILLITTLWGSLRPAH